MEGRAAGVILRPAKESGLCSMMCKARVGGFSPARGVASFKEVKCREKRR